MALKVQALALGPVALKDQALALGVEALALGPVALKVQALALRPWDLWP